MTADTHSAFLQGLMDHGLLIATGVEGLFGRGAAFEEVVDRFNAQVTRWGDGGEAEVMRFPPALSRAHFEKSGYLKSFPHLAGTIHSFEGNERDHAKMLKRMEAGEDWTSIQKATDLVVTPAACYAVYPTLAARGPLPDEGALVDVYSYCFRHEPSLDPARMQMFRMREYVRVGSPRQVVDFRHAWLERGRAMMEPLGLPFTVEVAHDPFFGRAGKMLASGQQDQQLKFELLIPITNEDDPTACISFNYHQDHFGLTWDLHGRTGETAHSGCVGFGMERVALALFRHHGFDPDTWPDSVRGALWP